MSVAWVGAAVAAVGAVSQASASSKASKAQQASANGAIGAEMDMFNQNREDQAPWRDAGAAGLNELSLRLGLSSARSGSDSQYYQDSQQIRDELVPLYTSEANGFDGARYDADYAAWKMADGGSGYLPAPELNNYMGRVVVDEAGLKVAIQKRMDEQAATKAAYEAQAKQDPKYGSLLRNFSAADMEADPVYQSGLQFGLNEGTKGINRQAAAGGNYLSGATLEALTRFGNDYGSTKANESYNRFNNNQTQTYNRLAGISGTGQTAAAQIASQGAQVANSVGNNMIGAGNARASGYISQGNALSGALGQGANIWQQNQLMNSNSFSPNISGSGYNPYANYDAVANGGWGAE